MEYVSNGKLSHDMCGLDFHVLVYPCQPLLRHRRELRFTMEEQYLISVWNHLSPDLGQQFTGKP